MHILLPKTVNLKHSKGYSMVELLVVIALISFLSAIAITNIPKINEQLALSRVAHTFAADLRRMQGMSLSVTDYNLSGSLVPVTGFGAYLITTTNTQYVLYADNVSANKQYTQGSDPVVSTITIEKGIIIKEIDNIAGNNASINFNPPNPKTTMTPVADFNTIYVVFALKSNTNVVKIVAVNKAGLIEVVSGTLSCNPAGGTRNCTVVP